MKYYIGFLFLTLNLALNAQKGVPNPVSWSFQMVNVSGSEYEFHANAEIQKNWNIYSKDMGNDGPVPTSITFEEVHGGVLDGEIHEKSKLVKVYDDLFEMEVLKIKDKVTYTQKFKIKNKGGYIKGYVNFMCCDNEKCLPPTNVPFELKF